jgi:hypothetical protein
MRLFHMLPSAAILTLGSLLAWPGDSAGMPDSSASGPGAAVARALPRDAFRDFLLENRSREDSLHYRQGEIAFGQEEFALALSHHLAADLPAAGDFRNDLLAQRSRIFARIWPSAAPVAGGKEDPDKTINPQKPVFDWGAGAEHSRWMDRAGPLFPEGGMGSADAYRDWKYGAYVRQSRPVSLGKNEMNLGLSAKGDRSNLGSASDYEAALEAEVPEGALEDFLLSISAGLGKSQDWGSHRYYGLLASKTWYSKDADAGFEAGYSRQWDGGWRPLADDAWAKANRNFPLTNGNDLHASLEVAATRQQSQAETPQTHFSFSPSLDYAFSMPAGLQAQAGAWYALDIYPEYAWDRIPWPDSLEPGPGPLEQAKTRRVDNGMGLDFRLWKDFPRGYSLSVESSADLRWTDLARTVPAAFRPWQWGLAFNLSRSSFRR